MSCPVLPAQLPAQPAMQLDVPFGFANFHVEAFLLFSFYRKGRVLVHGEAKIFGSYNALHKSGRPVFVYRPSLQDGFLTGLLLRNPGGVGVGIRPL